MKSGACWADHAKVHDWCRDISRWEAAILKWSARLKETKPIRLDPRRAAARAMDQLIRSCLYGDPCGCSTRKCHAFTTPDRPIRTVTRADCRACVNQTVLSKA